MLQDGDLCHHHQIRCSAVPSSQLAGLASFLVQHAACSAVCALSAQVNLATQRTLSLLATHSTYMSYLVSYPNTPYTLACPPAYPTTPPPSTSPQAPVSGSKKPAIDGQLIILAAGDEGLFTECAAAFDIMVRHIDPPPGELDRFLLNATLDLDVTVVAGTR